MSRIFGRQNIPCPEGTVELIVFAVFDDFFLEFEYCAIVFHFEFDFSVLIVDESRVKFMILVFLDPEVLVRILVRLEKFSLFLIAVHWVYSEVRSYYKGLKKKSELKFI